MTGVMLLLLLIGVADTLRAPVVSRTLLAASDAGFRKSRNRRDGAAAVIAAGLTVLLARVLGCDGMELLGVAAAAVAVVTFWLVAPRLPGVSGPVPQLLGLLVVMALVMALDPYEPSGGGFRTWYENLDWGFAGSVGYQQFAMTLVCTLFALASGNRVVTLVLEAAGTPRARGEQKLKGGRLLGPMERLIVAGMVLSGEPAGAAIVFAAKGLLRLPNVRDTDRDDEPDDEVAPDGAEPWTVAEYTEYFLIGTFASLLLAAGLALLVLGSS